MNKVVGYWNTVRIGQTIFWCLAISAELVEQRYSIPGCHFNHLPVCNVPRIGVHSENHLHTWYFAVEYK